MGCNDVKEFIAGYSSGDLPDSGWVSIESHIAECEECSLYLSRYEGVWDLLDEWREIEPRTDFVSGFWARVGEDERARERGIFGKLVHGWGLAGTFATVLVIAVFTFALLKPQRGIIGYADSDARDEQLLHELDKATTKETADSDALSIYGPWDSGVEIMRINGYGDMN